MAKWNKITQEEISTVVNGGKTASELSVLLNRSLHTIYKISRKYNVKFDNKPPRKYHLNESFFSEWTNDMAYVMGFIAADGCVLDNSRSGNPSVIEIGLAVKDFDHLNAIRDIICKDLIVKKREKSVRLCICSKKMATDLIEIGITQRKSTTLKFPQIPKQYVRHFIRGYFDGDGYIRVSKTKRFGHSYKNLEVSMLGTKDFLYSIREIFSKIYGKEVGSIRNQEKWYNAWRLTYSTKSAKDFAKWIYEGDDITKLNRKYCIYRDFIELSSVERKVY